MSSQYARRLLVLAAVITSIVVATNTFRSADAEGAQPKPGYRKVTFRYAVAFPNASAPPQLADFGTTILDDYGHTIQAYAPTSRLADLTRYGATLGFAVEQHDEYDLVQTAAGVLDTRITPATLQDSANSSTQAGTVRLYLAQFRGPAHTEWLDSLQRCGAEIDQPVVSNAVLITANAAVARCVAGLPVVQWTRVFTPELKARPLFRDRKTAPVVIEVAASGGGAYQSRLKELLVSGTDLTGAYQTVRPAIVGVVQRHRAHYRRTAGYRRIRKNRFNSFR